MSQQFDPKRAIRQLSPALLKAFLEKEGHPVQVDWGSPAKKRAEDVFDAWRALPSGAREAIELHLQDVHEMADERGVKAVIEEAQYHGEDLAGPLGALDSRYDKALWTMLNHPDIWHAARRFAQADLLATGRYWANLDTGIKKAPNTEPGTLDELTKALSAFYVHHEGRGHCCRVFHYPRRGAQDYFFAYLSDYTDAYQGFDDQGELAQIFERRAFQVVFAYERATGQLQMYAKGGQKVLKPLQAIFARTILGQDLPADHPGLRAYVLDHLMDRDFAFLTDPEDGVAGVSVKALRLTVLGGRGDLITLRAGRDRTREAIYEMLESDLNTRRLPPTVLRVTQATLSLAFNGNGHGKSLTFEVSYPNGCNLKSRRDNLRVIGEKYLRKWGIDVA